MKRVKSFWIFFLVFVSFIALHFDNLARAEEVIVDNTPPTIVRITPNTSAPAYHHAGDTLIVNFTYTEDNPSNYSIRVYNATDTICYKTNTSGLQGGTNITVTDTCVLSASANDGNFTLKVVLNDTAGNTAGSDTETDAVIIDSVPPVRANETPSNNSEVTSSPTTLGLDTDETAECRYSQSAGQSFADMTPFTNTNSTTHSSSIQLAYEGTYNFYVKCRDLAGNTNSGDYWIHFTYAPAMSTWVGHSAEMRFAFHIGTGDNIRSGNNHIASWNNNVVLGIVSGGTPIDTSLNTSYPGDDYLLKLVQREKDNKFLLVFTKGTYADITDNLEEVALKGWVGKTFGSFSLSEPSTFKTFLVLLYDNIDLNNSLRWAAGSYDLWLENIGKNSRGQSKINVTIKG